MNNILKLTKNILEKPVCFTNILSKYIMKDDKLKEFWELYKANLINDPITSDDFISSYSVQKDYNMNRTLAKKLAEDGLIRTKNGAYYLPDIKLLQKFLAYFDAAKNIEIIKETTITGQRKYLLANFYGSKNGKSIPENQIELMFSLFTDLFSNFYDIIPKKDVEIPEGLKLK